MRACKSVSATENSANSGGTTQFHDDDGAVGGISGNVLMKFAIIQNGKVEV